MSTRFFFYGIFKRALTQPAKRLRLGTRASALARRQADDIGQRLGQLGVEVQQVLISTRGDSQPDGPIDSLGEPGVFTKEIQRALLGGRIDLAVHSLKDLPTDPVHGLILAAILQRSSVADALVCGPGTTLEGLTTGAIVGTGSLRRRAQLLHLRPDLVVADVRGNVDTRINKLDAGQFHALLLAEAGLERLGLLDRIAQVLLPALFLPAVAQGALAVEVRADDRVTREAVASLDHMPSRQSVLAERAMLAALRGGCLAPVGGWARLVKGQLTLSGVVLTDDGSEKITHSDSADPERATWLGERVAEVLLSRGAAEMIAISRLGSSSAGP